MTWDKDAMTQGGEAKCHTNLDQNDKRWDWNDVPKWSGGPKWPLYVSVNRDTASAQLGIVKQARLRKLELFDRNTGTGMQIRQKFNALCPS